ncbi:MAG: hypothetical protein KKA60_04820, partial [Proteobacteria bacterium]|nr:hypothetical protein [Pseudomonadota bacterium]
QDHGYGKTHGLSAREMFGGLHRVGIATTGAWMVGFDFQNRENITEDLEDFIALNPCLQQLTRVCPFPGTPMWKEMKKQGRIPDDVDWKSISFYGGGGLEPANFNDHEVMALIEEGYKKLYHTHGASLARIMEVNMMGYEYCMENRGKNPYMEDRAVYNKRLCLTMFPLLKPMEIYAPNNIVRRRMKGLAREYIRLFGPPSSFQKNMERAMTGISGLNRFLDVLYPRDNEITKEAYKKYVYEKPAPAWPECPYAVSHPHRTWRFSAKRQMIGGLRSLLMDADRAGGAWDHIVRGLPQDEAMKRGLYFFFL